MAFFAEGEREPEPVESFADLDRDAGDRRPGLLARLFTRGQSG